MPYKQVKELLKHAVKFHEMLVDFYSGIEKESEKDSVKLLVNYMARHERVLKERLSGITAEQQKQLADEWLKNEPEYATCRCFENLKIDKKSTVDDVIDEGLRLNQCLINYYDKLAEIAPTEELTALFTSLKTMEIAEKKKLARIRGM